MTRKKHASKAERQIRRERLKDDQKAHPKEDRVLIGKWSVRKSVVDAGKRDVPPDLGKRTVQGVLIDDEQWEGHDL